MRLYEITENPIETINAYRLGKKPCEPLSMRNAALTANGINSIVSRVVNKHYKWVVNKYEVQIFHGYDKYRSYNELGSSKYSNMGMGASGTELIGRTKVNDQRIWLSFPQNGKFLAKCVSTFTKEQLDMAAQEILPKRYKKPLASLWRIYAYEPEIRDEFLTSVLDS